MKRSEAVELLAKRVFLKVDDITLHDASSLLFFIEERLGMVPPMSKVLFYQDTADSVGGRVMRTEHKWEPESEEK